MEATGHDATARSFKRHPRTSATTAAVAYAFIPLTIELTGHDSNPFYYNTVAKIAQVPIALLFLYSTANRYLPEGHANLRTLLSDRTSYLIALRDGRPFVASSPRDMFRMPLFWIAIGFFDYALFAWSTTHVDTAIASTIFELWPVLFVIFLVRLQDPIQDGPRQTGAGARLTGYFRAVTLYQWTLIALAPIGLYFVFISRSGAFNFRSSDNFGAGSIGILLALIGAVFASIPPAMTIKYGRLLQHVHSSGDRVSDTDTTSDRQSDGSAASVEDQQLWYTVLGFALALSLSAPANFLVGSIVNGGKPYVSAGGTFGGIILGAVLLAPASILLRKANHDTRDASVNGIFFFSPVLALVLLAAVGIVLPRFDYFLIGACLVLIVNILLQANPDRESDPSKFGIDPMQGTRKGFTSLILALWCFGTVIYLRDELFPTGWLEWDDAEYWGLLALSATVFALIFGFRVARLSGRISKEDDAMLTLFRLSERVLEALDHPPLRRSLLSNLMRLDRASPKGVGLFKLPPNASDTVAPDATTSGVRHLSASSTRYAAQSVEEERELSELLGAYLSAREDFRAARTLVVQGPENMSQSSCDELLDSLHSMELQLDVIAHSKQQGRDFSELISLTIFAVITIALGVAAHPASIVTSTHGWAPFLTELFAMLFVSTIGFLAANLFDLRRDREMPLLIGLHGDGGEPEGREYILFFRHKRELTAQRAIAVLLTLGVCAVYGVLLYSKWL